MSMRALFVATGLLVASLTPAFADAITATVRAWDAANRNLTLDDQTKFEHIPSKVVMPKDLKVGDRVTIDFEGSENGVDDITSITVPK